MYTKIEKAAIELLAANRSMTGPSATLLRQEINAKYPGAVARAIDRLKQKRDDARFVGTVPPVLKNLVKRYGTRVTQFRVRRSASKTYSSGYCYGNGEIVVTLGSDETDQRIVVLHEIAHLRDPWDRHGSRFYEEWRRLLVAEGLLHKAMADRPGQAHGLRRAAR